MNRTLIEWVKNPDGSQGFTWNPITGCLNHVNGLCKGGGFPCYAYKLANTRLKQRYLANDHRALPAITPGHSEVYRAALDRSNRDPFYPRFWQNRLDQASGVMPKAHYKGGWAYGGRGIFVCDMGDLFGVGVPEEWTKAVLDTITEQTGHRFYLLTKQPQRLPKFSPFPDNAWVGVTATGRASLKAAFWHLAGIQAKVKYLSLEPLLEEPPTASLLACVKGVDWLIVGACTGSFDEMAKLCSSSCREHTLTAWGNKWTAQPPIEWVREIVEAADKAGAKVFLKDNLRPLLIPEDCSKPNYLHEDIFWASEKAQLRQEMPE
jgi:protein gp37